MMSASRRRQKGQTLVIFALAFLVVMGFASLAIDGSHVYLVHRQDQNAADAGSLAGTGVFSRITIPITTSPASDSDPAMKVIHDVVASNGIATNYPSSCQAHTIDTSVTPNLNRFTAIWYDKASACNATTGFSWKVEVQVPPATLVGPCVDNPYDCIEVDITDRVTNYLLGALGTPVSQSFASATAYAKQIVPGINFTGVPPTAVWLYEGANPVPGSCNPTPTKQCFTRNGPPSKTQMVCGVDGCPTFWVQPLTDTTIVGIDGKVAVTPPADTSLALYSAGDAVLQAPTTVCDPYNAPVPPAAACPNANPQGYAFSGGAKIYCSSKTPAAGPTPCTTTKPGNPAGPPLAALTGNEATAPAPFTFIPAVTAPTRSCGGLILNGEAITGASFTGGPDPACIPPIADQYTILPGIYSYIVINHGQYTFERGLYDITGLAPVNTSTDPNSFANGIDHSRETNAIDFDLCNQNSVAPAPCPTLRAGVWIGRGRLNFHAASAGNSSQCAPGQPQSGTQGGGGDPTIIDGSGVSFRLRDSSGGFVSTGEVQTISLVGPSPGSMSAIKGAPTLIDMENPTTTIHLDSIGTAKIGNATIASGFGGLIFQTQNATAGGVELDPALSGTSAPAVNGQVVAFSLTLFGGAPGTAVDFTGGYGNGGSVIVPTARLEGSIITTNVPAHPIPYTLVDNGDGTETYTQFYGDEFALDAYDTYFKINGGNPIFFSRGLWNPPPAPGDPLPPNGAAQTNPDDNIPARPSDATAAPYTVVTAPNLLTFNGNDILHDWSIAGTDPSIATTLDPTGSFVMRTNGYWTWGHETVIAGTKRLADQSNQTSVSLKFPKQSGKTIQLQGYMTDGDRCGDYATFDVTLTQPGGPGGGSKAVPGGQQLMQ